MSKAAWDLTDDIEGEDVVRTAYTLTASRASSHEFNIAIHQRKLNVPLAADTDLIFRWEDADHNIVEYTNETQGRTIYL